MSQKLHPETGTLMETIAKKYFPCTCGEIYLSRKLTAPDCPFHANDWESAMEEYASQFKPSPSGSAEEAADAYMVKQGTHDRPDITRHDFIQGYNTAMHDFASRKPAGEVYSSSGKWIRVEDDLPKHNENRDSEWCNVCIDGKVSYIPAWHKGDTENYAGRWFQLDVPYPIKNVTHWQPLPAPPESVK